MSGRVSETTMAPRSSGFELELAAETDNVPLVRHALRGLLEASGVAEERISDITLAVTEACANAVLHAYADSTGQFEASAELSAAGELVVTVRDHGAGMAPRVDSPGLGVGLPVMAAIADALEIDTPDGDGTVVRMTFVVADAATR
jgi:serine/threonine-protein kinase RsbW/stage II sporulation protein AB (anti-sigma F factor)